MKKIILIIIILIISSYFFIEFVSDNLVKNILQKNISSSLNRDVSIKKLNINYLNGEVDAKEIKLLNKKFHGYLLNIKTRKAHRQGTSLPLFPFFFITLSSFCSLFTHHIH